MECLINEGKKGEKVGGGPKTLREIDIKIYV
jgi:hypothetical protein